MISSNIDQFFDCQNQEWIRNNTVTNFTEDPTSPQICHYTTLWNVNVLKKKIENTTS